MQQFNHIDIILWRTLAIFLLMGALMGMAVALLLIFKPHLIARVNRVANRWVSMRHISRWMDRSIRIERWCYRHHRPLGLLLTLGGGYILVYFGWRFDKTTAMHNGWAGCCWRAAATCLSRCFSGWFSCIHEDAGDGVENKNARTS